jgi:hypothetical protein
MEACSIGLISHRLLGTGDPQKSFMKTILVVLCAVVSAFAQVSVLTQHNDNARTGANLSETTLKPSNVDVKHFGMLFKRVLDDQVYGQPLYVANVTISGGTHDVVYLTTVNNSVYAFDANEASASKPFWHVNFGVPASLADGKFGCLDMNGNAGIVGTPVIDATSQTLYVVALTRVRDGYAQRLHALDLATGADLPNSPVTITASGFDPLKENQRPGLLLANGMIYIAYSSHCDKKPYHGFVISYDTRSLERLAVFNTSPTGMAASIWQSGQGPAADAEGNIYFVTGNGSWDGAQNFSESFMKLDSKLKLLDWFTPTNHIALDSKDDDINSSGPTLVPGTDLVMDGGKGGVLYLVNGRHMGHLGDENAVQGFPVSTSHIHSIAYWNSAEKGPMIYMWGQKDQLRVYRFRDGKLETTPSIILPEVNGGHPGAMVSISANGNKDGILWAALQATGDAWHESRPGILRAFDANDVHHELWNSLQNPARDDCNNYSKMAPPTIANGKVYLPSFGTENIGTGQFCVYGPLPDGDAPAAPTSLTAKAGDSTVALTWSVASGARTYNVKRATGPNGSFSVVSGGLTSPKFVDETALNNKTYLYVVSAANSNGESAESAQVTAKPSRQIPVDQK